MNSPDPRLGRLLLLGKNYDVYGAIGSTNVGTEAAAGISVGSDLDSPSKQWKYDHTVDNEDGLCVIAAPDWIGMAVADAHYGPESSHMLLERLHAIWAKVRPTDIDHLGQMIEFLRQGDPAQTESETTFLAAIYDRSSRKGFGISFGDSTFAITGRNRVPVALNEHDSRFVNAGRRGSLRHGSPFEFEAKSGDLLLAFTDGVDGCHYRRPETSVQPEHIHDIAVGTSMDPLETVNEVVTLALKGVDGSPGGQDNIAMIAALA
jgi:hypothetical protein